MMMTMLTMITVDRLRQGGRPSPAAPRLVRRLAGGGVGPPPFTLPSPLPFLSPTHTPSPAHVPPSLPPTHARLAPSLPHTRLAPSLPPHTLCSLTRSRTPRSLPHASLPPTHPASSLSPSHTHYAPSLSNTSLPPLPPPRSLAPSLPPSPPLVVSAGFARPSSVSPCCVRRHKVAVVYWAIDPPSLPPSLARTQGGRAHAHDYKIIIIIINYKICGIEYPMNRFGSA